MKLIEDMSRDWSGILTGWWTEEVPVVPANATVRFLSTRAKQRLQNDNHPIDPEHVSKLSDYELLGMPGLGRTTLMEIRNWSATHGFPHRD